MRIQIIGVGVVGSAQAYLASQLRNEVLGFDPSRTTSEYATMVKQLQKDVDITFITTPEAIVDEVVDNLVRNQIGGLYVIKSTVPSGTTNRLMEKYQIHICHNPEFLKEKTSLEDIMHPEAIIVGQCCYKHADLLRRFYQPLGAPIAITEPTISETVKLSINSYLAVLITFWNEVDAVSKALGISTREVAGLAKLNSRISAYGTEFFGSPFGGKCLPKDLEQLLQLAQNVKVNSQMLQAVQDYNRTLSVMPSDQHTGR
jgi:UDPglucose 6-dehydrogenase